MTDIPVLIIDDEEPARVLIRQYLQNYPNFTIAGEASNGFDAAKLIKELQPKLIILDIQMPKLTGFEMLELIENPPLVIFSTAYDQYALKAFEQHAVDYLLKPFSQQRFDAAIHKAVQHLESGNSNPVNFSDLQEQTYNPTEFLTRIAVKDRHQIHVIAIDNLVYIEADGDYVKLHTKTDSFLKEKTMKYFEEHLSPKQFVRIHRSYIVNVDEVTKIELYDKESYRVYLKNNIQLKASNSGYKLLKQIVQL